jgi:hypothetical protein
MKCYSQLSAVLAMSFISSMFVPSLSASESDLKTVITISQPVSVQGTILPAGRYVLRLQNSLYTREVVSILNAGETQVIATVLANHAYRLQATGKSEFSFYDASTGQPAALRKWFYPGEDSGFEFLNLPNKAAANPIAIAHSTESPRQNPQQQVGAEFGADGRSSSESPRQSGN